ncbi:MAG: methyltransferase domain-containing protein [Pseudomonadales bacterium]|nr:methyltransferase domain-containing protein [Pseudomonadales bacterium]
MFKRILRKKDRKSRYDFRRSAKEVGRWFSEGRGQALLAAEKSAIDLELENHFGYHLLEISVCENSRLSSASPVQHCFCLNPMFSHLEKGALAARLDAFPIESESLDIVLLHHVIEFAATPHQTLKEVSRVLIPRGHAVLVVFNRWSLIGIWKKILGLSANDRSQDFQSLSPQRIEDWCKLLDMEPVSIQHVYYGFPAGSGLVKKLFGFLESLGQRFGLPFGAVYILTLQKNLNALTPLKPDWRISAPRLGRFSAVQPLTGRVPSAPFSQQKKKVLH